MKKAERWIFLLVNIVFGIYLINITTKTFIIPEVLKQFDPYFIAIGGILIIIGGINYMRTQHHKISKHKE